MSDEDRQNGGNGPAGPPPRRPGPPPQYRGPQRPTQRPPMPPREGTQIIRRDGRPTSDPQANQAWSQAPPVNPRPSPSPSPRPTNSNYAPRQTPERFSDDYRQQPPGPPRPPSAPRGRTEPEQPAPKKTRKKRHWGRRFGILLLVIVVALAGLLYYVDSSLTRVEALTDYPGRVADTAGTNWLLVGSDSRTGLTPEQEQALATGGETGPSRTDTILLVHIPKSGATTMVSIPRDTYVPIPGFGKDKINASFARGGASLLVQTVEGFTGVHIDHYAEIGFGGFAGIVDAVGGVNVCLQSAIDDPLAGVNLPAGCQDLTGPQALGFVRSRATALADLDRMNNQRTFMSALLKKATSPSTLLNPFRLWPFIKDTASTLQIDNGDHIWNLASLAWALRGTLVTTTVPVAGFEDVDGSGNVLLLDDTKATQFFGALINDQQIPADLLTTN